MVTSVVLFYTNKPNKFWMRKSQSETITKADA